MVALSWWPEYMHTCNPVATAIASEGARLQHIKGAATPWGRPPHRRTSAGYHFAWTPRVKRLPKSTTSRTRSLNLPLGAEMAVDVVAGAEVRLRAPVTAKPLTGRRSAVEHFWPPSSPRSAVFFRSSEIPLERTVQFRPTGSANRRLRRRMRAPPSKMVALPLWLEYMHTPDRMATTSPGQNCNTAHSLYAINPRGAP